MSKVYVFNENNFPLKELFKGEEILLLAKDYWRDKQGNKKPIDLFEANDFRGTYHPVPIDGSGKMLNDPRYYKMIRLEPVGGDEAGGPALPTFRCMAPDCKHVSPSEEELEAHCRVRHATLEGLILPEEDARLKKKVANAK